MTGYDVVVCCDCGAAYASSLPEREVFDTYYARMSKYEQSQRSGELSSVDRGRFSQVADALAPHLNPAWQIVDVGCATGGLLAELQRRGFQRLLGLDPSPACAAVAKRLYDIEVRTTTIHEVASLDEKFDVMVLTGVFEHLPELDESIVCLKRIIKPGGMLYLEVPDVTSYYQWFGAPYQFLSIEHVNFFSPISLGNLLARHGFECVFARRAVRYLGPKSVEPAVSALFKLTGKTAPFKRDQETEPKLEKYLEASAKLEAEIHAKIKQLVDSQKPLAIWGAGTHTLRLLETSALPKAHIVAIIDSNSRYKGKQLHGLRILTPDEFKSEETTILISSQVAEEEIKTQIRKQLRWNNAVVCLYENAQLRSS